MPEKEEKQIVVVKHGSNSCVTCLIILLIIFVGLPILAFTFKVAFIAAILQAVRNMLGI